VLGGGGGGGGGTVGDSWAFTNERENKLISNIGRCFLFVIKLSLLKRYSFILRFLRV
jgi:hypothetical protein